MAEQRATTAERKCQAADLRAEEAAKISKDMKARALKAEGFAEKLNNRNKVLEDLLLRKKSAASGAAKARSQRSGSRARSKSESSGGSPSQSTDSSTSNSKAWSSRR
mmetsp:Transcript_101652/g.206537  ORF Transcript_101652/g.206537 Transcript_101652/m.206537 type:complete len:107 (+) Transcript_101652:848-1168(+)